MGDVFSSSALDGSDAVVPVIDKLGRAAKAMAVVIISPDGNATGGSAGATPLAGSTAANADLGPYAPDLNRAIWLRLSGVWAGTVTLLRSVDGGATKLPLTYGDGSAKPAWSGNMQAPVAEETVAGATYYLRPALTSGSLEYRMEQ